VTDILSAEKMVSKQQQNDHGPSYITGKLPWPRSVYCYNSIDLVVTGSKVKVTVTFNVNIIFYQ